MFFPNGAFMFIKWWKGANLHPENVLLDVVWQRLDLVCSMGTRWYRKDCIYVNNNVF